MSIRKEKRPLDVTYHIDTPGVPITARYVQEVIETNDDGTETVLKSETVTDCNVSAADLARHLGDSLVSGRTEEQRALAAEAAAHAACQRHEAEIARLREEIAAQVAHIRDQEAQIQRASETCATAATEITRLRAALAEAGA